MADYNGWTNKDTWLVNVWFGDWITEMVEENREDSTPDMIEELVEMERPELDGFWSDVIGMLDVNYHELAEHFLYEGGDEDEDEDEDE